MTIGNRIFLKRPACSVDLLKEFEQLPAANIADTMNRIAVLGNGLQRRRPFASADGRDHGGLRPLHEESRRYRAGRADP